MGSSALAIVRYFFNYAVPQWQCVINAAEKNTVVGTHSPCQKSTQLSITQLQCPHNTYVVSCAEKNTVVGTHSPCQKLSVVFVDEIADSVNLPHLGFLESL